MSRWTRENKYDDAIAAAAKRHGVPVWVIKTTIAKESGFNPSAFTGSIGLMQLEEATARDLGFKGVVEGLYDPAVSIALGTAYLARQAKRYPKAPWDEIYAAYNSGAIRKNDRGQLVNTKGLTNVEEHVAGWRRAADYFRPGWRSEKRPTRPAR